MRTSVPPSALRPTRWQTGGSDRFAPSVACLPQSGAGARSAWHARTGEDAHAPSPRLAVVVELRAGAEVDEVAGRIVLHLGDRLALNPALDERTGRPNSLPAAAARVPRSAAAQRPRRSRPRRPTHDSCPAPLAAAGEALASVARRAARPGRRSAAPSAAPAPPASEPMTGTCAPRPAAARARLPDRGCEHAGELGGNWLIGRPLRKK